MPQLIAQYLKKKKRVKTSYRLIFPGGLSLAANTIISLCALWTPSFHWVVAVTFASHATGLCFDLSKNSGKKKVGKNSAPTSLSLSPDANILVCFWYASFYDYFLITHEHMVSGEIHQTFGQCSFRKKRI